MIGPNDNERSPMDAVSNVNSLEHVASLLKEHDDYVIVPHVAPDPDAFGAACGLAVLLSRMGKKVRVYTDEVIPDNCRFFHDYFPIGNALPPHEGWKLIFVDGGEQKRQPAPVRELGTWMNLDHHLENGLFAKFIYVDTAAAATSLIVARLAKPLGVDLDVASASCLFAGLLFDTRGGFITDKCTPELFEMTARLVEAGARPDEVNRTLNEQMTLADFKLYGMALAGLQTAMNGQLVYVAISAEMVLASGGTDQATEMLTVNLPKIQGGEIYVLFKESEGCTKMSFRSKGRLAVNAIAKQFGGGGHKFAAGARLEMPLSKAIAAVVAACEASLQAAASV
jgi:phosphoesterase RecJ-like protein